MGVVTALDTMPSMALTHLWMMTLVKWWHSVLSRFLRSLPLMPWRRKVSSFALKAQRASSIEIDRIANDRHVSITSFMNKERPQINHQYDVWHLSKWVVKKLISKAQQKGCEEFMPWIQSISKQLWWCAATCDGNVVLLREKWISVLHHIANKRKWTGITLFHPCGHRQIPSSEAQNICWHLTQLWKQFFSTQSFSKTQLSLQIFAILVKQVYHSMMLKYCSKQEHFSYKGMDARTTCGLRQKCQC